MDLENELRLALRRTTAPAGFADRVLARNRRRRSSGLFWATGVAAAALIGFFTYQRYQQMAEEQAGRQAVLALRIAAEKLNYARAKVLRISTEN